MFSDNSARKHVLIQFVIGVTTWLYFVGHIRSNYHMNIQSNNYVASLDKSD